MSLNNISNVNSNSVPSPLIMKILWRQQQELLTKSPDSVKIIINQEDPLDIQADIIGPKDTPYEGSVFRVKICVSSDFPYTAPKGIFITKIYHPNVSEKGEICVNTLKKDWNPKGWSLYNVLEVIKCLLIIPFPESSLNEEAGKLFMEDYNEYFKIARIFAQVYAKPLETGFTKNLNTSSNSNYNTNSDVEMNECQMIDSENLNNFYSQNPENFNALKTKSMSHEINYGHNNNNNDNLNFPNTGGSMDYGLLSRIHSKSVSVKNPQSLIKSKNSLFLSLNRKSSNLDSNFIMNKPNINSLPFILRSNSFCNNENMNVVTTGNNTNTNNVNLQTPTPTRSKKDEIKKWLSRI